MKNVSCGIILANPAGWLICHSTNNSHWDFPKGLKDGHEDPLACAVRELKEETSYILKVSEIDDLIDLGRHAYNREKDLQMFYVWCDWIINADSLICPSTFTHESGVVYPEMDDFDVLPSGIAIPKLSGSMQRWATTNVPIELRER